MKLRLGARGFVRHAQMTLAAAIVATLAANAQAATLKVDYAGHLTDVSGALLADFFLDVDTPKVGDSFTGGFLFDLTTPDGDADPAVGIYSGGNAHFYVDFGLDSNGKTRRYEQDVALPYNHAEVGNDITRAGSPLFDIWTSYGQLANDRGYGYVETGMVLASFALDALASDDVPLSVDAAKFVTPGCDPNGVNGNNGFFCARAMEFHARKAPANPDDIYGDVDIYGDIDEIVIARVPDTRVPEPDVPALLAGGLLALVMLRRRQLR